MADRILLPGEVAELFRVDVKSVGRWAKAGQPPSFLTPGGQLRFMESEVDAFLAKQREQ